MEEMNASDHGEHAFAELTCHHMRSSRCDVHLGVRWRGGTTQGDLLLAFAIAANDKQWAKSEKKLRTMLDTFRA